MKALVLERPGTPDTMKMTAYPLQSIGLRGCKACSVREDIVKMEYYKWFRKSSMQLSSR